MGNMIFFFGRRIFSNKLLQILGVGSRIILSVDLESMVFVAAAQAAKCADFRFREKPEEVLPEVFLGAGSKTGRTVADIGFFPPVFRLKEVVKGKASGHRGASDKEFFSQLQDFLLARGNTRFPELSQFVEEGFFRTFPAEKVAQVFRHGYKKLG
jgi:hypothetical protein